MIRGNRRRGDRWRSAVGVALAAGAALALLRVTPGELFGFGPLLLYNRLNRKVSLNNETRRRVFDYVQRMPASCIADVAAGVGVSHSTASYHLDKLCAFNLLTQTADGNKVRFFLNGGIYTEDERRALAVLDNAETRRVLRTIVENPWCYRAELTHLLDVSSPTVNWHLDRLNACRVIRESRAGRNRFLSVDMDVLRPLIEGLLDKLSDTGYESRGLQELLEACRGQAP